MKNKSSMKTKLLTLLLILLGGLMTGWSKTKVRFYKAGENLLITLDEKEDGTVTDFYYIVPSGDIPTDVLVDGKYRVIPKDKFVVFHGKKVKLIFTTDVSIVQAAFRQRLYYILADGMFRGHLNEPLKIETLLKALQGEMSHLKLPVTWLDEYSSCKAGLVRKCDDNTGLCKCVREEEMLMEEEGQ